MPAAVPLAIVGGSVIGGAMAANAAGDAADSQSQASQYATDAQLEATLAAAAMEVEAALIAAGVAKETAKMQADAIRYSTDQQVAVTREQLAQQMEFFGRATGFLRPWRNIGKRGLWNLEQQIRKGPGEFKKSPGYQYRLDQGNKNILANASATGGIASGRTLKALQSYGQDYASTEYQNFLANYYQSLTPDMTLASMGANAAAGMGNNAMSASGMMGGAFTNLATAYGQQGANLSNIYGQQGATTAGIYTNLGQGLAQNYMNQGNIIGQNYMNQGNIAAQGAIGQANAWTGAINNTMSGLGMMYGYGGGGWGGGWGLNNQTVQYGSGQSQNPAIF